MQSLERQLFMYQNKSESLKGLSQAHLLHDYHRQVMFACTKADLYPGELHATCHFFCIALVIGADDI